MSKNKVFFGILLIVIVVLGLLMFAVKREKQQFGFSEGWSVIPLGVWAVHPTSSDNLWQTIEIIGSLSRTSAIKKVLVSSTPIRILAPQAGRVYGRVCNEGATTGYLFFYAGDSVTSTAGQENTFTSSTGGLPVLANTCLSL